ncbi:hypothetical protein TWF281_002610 [Arthrobotrys megalospora]
MFKALSTYPCSKTLKKLILDSPDEAESPPLHSRHNQNLRALPVENGIQGSEFANLIRESFNFEEIVLTINQLHFDEANLDGIPSFGTSLVTALASTIKRLEIGAGIIGYPAEEFETSGQIPTFPNVKHLRVAVGEVREREIKGISYMFPNVEELMLWLVDGQYCIYEWELPYWSITRMTKLKRVFLSRPTNPEWELMTRKELQVAVESWIGLGRDPTVSRLSLLESVEFCSERRSIGCRILWKAQTWDGTGDRYMPMMLTDDDEDHGYYGQFDGLQFEWQSITKGFWERRREDPELRHSAGMPLTNLERELDVYFHPSPNWPVVG